MRAALSLITGSLIAGGLAVAGAAHATTFTGSATGAWSNPSATGATYTITNDDNVTGTNGLASFDFGTAATPADYSNLLTFDGVGTVNNPTPFTTTGNSAFALGNFVYRNGTTVNYPGGDSTVGLGITLALTQPSGLPTSMFSYTIGLDITPNTSTNPLLNADTATIMGGTTATTFQVAGQSYTLSLLGFSKDGGATFTNTFVALEQTMTSAKLYATITTNVPEPASLALLAAGLFGLGWMRRAARS